MIHILGIMLYIEMQLCPFEISVLNEGFRTPHQISKQDFYHIFYANTRKNIYTNISNIIALLYKYQLIIINFNYYLIVKLGMSVV